MLSKRTSLFILLFIVVALISGCTSSSTPGTNYTVKGTVKDSDGNGVAGVTMSVVGVVSGTTTTDSNGQWTMVGLNGSVTVNALKEGMLFTPDYITVQNTNNRVNFAGKYASEDAVKAVIAKLSDGYINSDVNSVLSVYDNDYFANIEQSRWDFESDLYEEFSYIAYTSYNFTCTMKASTFGATEATVKGKLEMSAYGRYSGKTASTVIYTGFKLVKRDTGWLIVDQVPYSPDESTIQTQIDNFLNAFKNGNLAAINSLIDSRLKSISGLTGQLNTTFAQNPVSEYQITDSWIVRQDEYNYVGLNVNWKISSYGQVKSEDAEIYFTFVQEGDNWLIDELVILSDTLEFYYVNEQLQSLPTPGVKPSLEKWSAGLLNHRR